LFKYICNPNVDPSLKPNLTLPLNLSLALPVSQLNSKSVLQYKHIVLNNLFFLCE